MNCMKCGKILPAGNKFCIYCGTPAPAAGDGANVCPSCGASNTPGNKFCIYCGTKLESSEGGSGGVDFGKCVSCGAALKPGDKFCQVCGKPVDEKATENPPDPPMKLVLTNLDEPGISYTVTIKDKVTVGRKSGEIVIADDPEVSRKHCSILREEDSLYVVDEGSMNGVICRNERIPSGQKVLINSGDQIRIGKYMYSLTLEPLLIL